MEYRPLEGFVLAITPFNFTSIAGNLPTAPALLGNVVVWKPSPTQQLAAHYIMRLLEAAGLPPGVINLVTGDGQAVSQVALTHPDLAGIHFTGSTATFQHLWRTVGENIARYRNYPRLVGETGGKDFVIAHPSADPPSLAATLIRGAFEYQGQKCSAASRAYVPESVWNRTRDDFLAQVESLTMGDVASDLSLFMGAVIDARAFAKHAAAIDRARNTATINVAGRRQLRRHAGILRPADGAGVLRPDRRGVHHRVLRPDPRRARLPGRRLRRDAGPGGRRRPVRADRRGPRHGPRTPSPQATEKLRYSAGNFYINDKPTGAVVGQQPFGGARASGTDDKAGSVFNLIRWVSARAIKELFVPPSDYRYPHMG